MMKMVLKIGSRRSALALVQTDIFIQKLLEFHPFLSKKNCDVIARETSGDLCITQRLSDIGGKGLFTKELDAALLTGEIDIAVYSLKDVETILPHNIVIACVLERGDPRDVLVSKTGDLLKNLPYGASIGTASLRRQSQLLSHRPDLNVRLIRGNVPTRLEKLYKEDLDGTLLALAGLQRLGLEHVVTEILDPAIFVPAAGQGALVACVRQDRSDLLDLLAPLTHQETEKCIQAERHLLKALDASCRTPVGAYAIPTPLGILLRGFLGTEDGMKAVCHAEEGNDPEEVGSKVAASLQYFLENVSSNAPL